MAYGVVGVVVVVRVGEGVMSQELQPLRKAFVYLYLERVVGACRVVAVIVAQVEGNGGEQWASAVLRGKGTESTVRSWTAVASIGG